VQSSSQNHRHQQTNIHFILQAGCPSCRPTNSVKALKGKCHSPWTLKCSSKTMRVFADVEISLVPGADTAEKNLAPITVSVRWTFNGVVSAERRHRRRRPGTIEIRMHLPARYDGARRRRHSKTIATSRPDRKPTEVTLVKLVEQLHDDNLYRYDADGVKVVFFGFLEQMNCAESARTREALDVAQDSRDGQVSSCGRHRGHCSRRCAIQFSFGNLFGFRPTTDKKRRRSRKSFT